MTRTSDKPRAFFLEDEPRLCSSVVNKLDSLGFRTTTATDAAEAERKLRKNPAFDLIVLDLRVDDDEYVGWDIRNLCDDELKISPDCTRVIFSGYSEHARHVAKWSQWMFIAKGAGGLEKLLAAARNAFADAIYRKSKPPQVDPDRAHRVLDRSHISDEWKNVYVLGCFEKRRTFFSQQVRALELVRALWDLKRLRSKTTLGVVGAGAAGATAAVAAAILGCKVRLYDKASGIMHLQAGAGHRYLHPHIYDWPAPNSLCVDAGLPILTWSANYADLVIRSLQREFGIWEKELKRKLRFLPGSHIQPLRASDNRHTITLRAGLDSYEHDAVILAQGFGLESEVSYWGGDSLSDPVKVGTSKLLISGVGDGGLVDLARAAIRTHKETSVCRHDELIKLCTEDALEPLGKQMFAIDQHALATGRVEDLYKQYKRGIKIPPSVRARLISLKRNETDVYFNYRRDGVFNLNSALVNRLVAFLLLETRLVTPRQGHMTIMPAPRPSEAASSYVVRFTTTNVKDAQEIATETFHAVVARHGDFGESAKKALLIPIEKCASLKAFCERRDDRPTIDESTMAFWGAYIKGLRT